MTVLRLKINDRIDVRLKNGELVLMEISSCNGKNGILTPIAREKEATGQGVSAFSVENQTASVQSKELWLFQFMPKPQKMDLIIRQSTECGVSVIVPIVGDFSVNQDGKGRLERFERIIKEARQQSGSPISTKVLEPVSVEKAAALWNTETSKGKTKAYILHEDGEQAKDLKSLLKSEEEPEKIALAVGCEGGFSPKEFEILKQADFLPLHFNTNVLRAETAALYGIAVLQQLLYL